VLLDQLARDRGSSAVELTGALARFAEQDDPCIREAIEHRAEALVTDIR
jgi:hypothetical protein